MDLLGPRFENRKRRSADRQSSGAWQAQRNRRPPTTPPPPSLSTWNRPEPELQSEREMGEGSAQLGPHRIASCDPNHKSPVLLQCPVYPAAAIGRAAKLWRIERAPSMPTPRCFAVAGGTACLPLQPLLAPRSPDSLTHSLTHQPTRQPLIAGCRRCCCCLHLINARIDRINHARPHTPSQIVGSTEDRH